MDGYDNEELSRKKSYNVFIHYLQPYLNGCIDDFLHKFGKFAYDLGAEPAALFCCPMKCSSGVYDMIEKKWNVPNPDNAIPIEKFEAITDQALVFPIKNKILGDNGWVYQKGIDILLSYKPMGNNKVKTLEVTTTQVA
jgi:hypothetical protein